jgi:hypothetical protein
VVPGGAHTYAKSDDQYPEGMALVIDRSLGCPMCDATGTATSSVAAVCARPPSAKASSPFSMPSEVGSKEASTPSSRTDSSESRPMRVS